MMTKDLPMIYETKSDEKALARMIEYLNTVEKRIIKNYPTVYLFNYKKNDLYEVYVGETTDIIRRTSEHLNASRRDEEDWRKMLKNKQAKMFVIGHSHFNKSLTLDIEHRLMLYMASIENVKKVHNRRGNSQNEYYTSDELNDIFSMIWNGLRNRNPELFPIESIITDSALFKASPLQKLTEEQYGVKRATLQRTQAALKENRKGQVILIAGEAGTGKTVLISSLFYELNTYQDEFDMGVTNSYLLVNHDQQLLVYQQIAEKLCIYKKDKQNVGKPTQFINSHTTDDVVDVVLVDEAHLLWTQGKQSYQGKDQLEDIIDRARVVIVIFDEKQILRTEQYREDQKMQLLKSRALENGHLMELKNQLRIKAEPVTIDWIRGFIDRQEINIIPHDKKGYEIKIYNTPAELHDEIKEKAKCTKSGLSRLVATFDWEYVDKKGPESGGYWEVVIDDWRLPWNLQIKPDSKARKRNKKLSWAEQEHTINEVGSTYTIQGFDLNYVGVILGPSVKYRNGKVVFDPAFSKNKKATQMRTLSDGSKKQFAKTLLRNEVNVLMTRGVSGLYIYAQDKELREALLEARKL